ncbi:MAG: polymer-forming cytoskeletal protein [Candidatus Hydrogenedentes bacterium]|nr:polymer-forming cytoskeletal protein [Candidatus Hydrogenedentota bacterium]
MSDSEHKEGTPPKKYLNLDLNELTRPGSDPAALEDLGPEGRKGSIFSRFSSRFTDLIETSRGPSRHREPAVEAGDRPDVTADDLAIRRAKGVKAQRMIVPEGVIIDGSMSSGSETEISGRVEGNVTVDGRLYLGASALVSGNVRATTCKVEGLVEGKMECSDELELGRAGRLNADVLAGRKMVLAGQVFGNVITNGSLHIAASAKVTGDIRAKSIVIEEGAVFNGKCAMRPPAQRSEK